MDINLHKNIRLISKAVILALGLIALGMGQATAQSKGKNKKNNSKQVQSQLEKKLLLEDAAQGLIPDGALFGPGSSNTQLDSENVETLEIEDIDDELVDLEDIIRAMEAAEQEELAVEEPPVERPEIVEEPVVVEEPEVIEELEIAEEPEIAEELEIAEEPEIVEEPEIAEEPEIVEELVVVEPEPELIVREPLVFSGVRLRRTKGQLRLDILSDEKVEFVREESGDDGLAVRMLFARDISFANGRKELQYNDALLERIFVEKAPESKFRLVVELKSLAPSKVSAGRSGLVVRLDESVQARELLGVRLISGNDLSRLLLDLSLSTRFSSVFRHGELWVLLRDVKPLTSLPIRHEDGRLRLEWIKKQRGNTILKIRVKNEELVSRVIPLDNPARLVIDIIGKLPSSGLQGADSIDLGPYARERRGGYISLDEEMIRAQQLFEQGLGTIVGQQAFWEIGDILFRKAQAGVRSGWYRVVQFYENGLRDLPRAMLSRYGGRGFYQLGAAYRGLGLREQSDEALMRLGEFSGAPEEADAYYLLARNALEVNNVARAVDWFRKMRALVVTVSADASGAAGVEALYWEGITLELGGHHDEALETLESALQLNPKYTHKKPALLFGIAETFATEGPLKARGFYTLLFELEGRRYYGLLTARARQLNAAGILPEALSELAKLRDYAPPLLALAAELQMANLRASGDEEERQQAIRGYQRVIVSASADAELKRRATEGLAALSRGQAERLLSEGRVSEAIAHLEHLLILARGAERRLLLSRLGEYQSQLVVMLGRQSDWKAILTKQQEFVSRWRQLQFAPLALYYTAMAFERNNRATEAESAYAEALRADFGLLNGKAAYQQGQLLSRQGRFDRSRRILERLLRSEYADQYFPQAGILHAYALEKIGRFNDATRGYLAIVKRLRLDNSFAAKMDLAETLYQLGKLYTNTEQHQKAFNAYLQASQLKPRRKSTPPEIQHSTFLAAEALAQLGKPRQALAQYKKALAQYPKHTQAPWAHYQIGVQWMRLGNFSQARSQFKLVSQLPGKPNALWRSLALEKEKDLAKRTAGG